MGITNFSCIMVFLGILLVMQAVPGNYQNESQPLLGINVSIFAHSPLMRNYFIIR